MWSLKEFKYVLNTTVSVKYLTSVLKSKECCCNRVKRVFIDEIFCPSIVWSAKEQNDDIGGSRVVMKCSLRNVMSLVRSHDLCNVENFLWREKKAVTYTSIPSEHLLCIL